jgi:hypothetical protein
MFTGQTPFLRKFSFACSQQQFVVLLGVPVSLLFRLAVPVKKSTCHQFLIVYALLGLYGKAHPCYFHSFDGAPRRVLSPLKIARGRTQMKEKDRNFIHAGAPRRVSSP